MMSGTVAAQPADAAVARHQIANLLHAALTVTRTWTATRQGQR